MSLFYNVNECPNLTIGNLLLFIQVGEGRVGLHWEDLLKQRSCEASLAFTLLHSENYFFKF